MEYNREDKRKKKRKKKKKGKNKTKNLQITATTGTLVNENMNFDENKKERLRFKCGFPSLKTIGEQIQMLTLQTLENDLVICPILIIQSNHQCTFQKEKCCHPWFWQAL